MPALFDPSDVLLLDPDTITEDEVDLAHSDVTPTEFPADVEDQDLEDDFDDRLRAAGLLAPMPNTPREGLAVFAAMRRHHTPIGGVGLCHYNCRHFGWNLAALWGTAAIALENGAPVHWIPLTPAGYASIPRGAQIGGFNGGAGHSWTGLGASLSNTSDFHELGFNGVAKIANVVEWAGLTKVGWYETVNGVDVWPNRAKPKPPPPAPPAWDWEARVAWLKAQEAEARHADHPKVAAQIQRWRERIVRHHTH